MGKWCVTLSLTHLTSYRGYCGVRGVKLPKGFNGTLNTDGDIVRGIVVSGELNYTLPQTKETKTLDAGSSFSSTAKAIHTVANSDDVVVYIRTNGAVKVK